MNVGVIIIAMLLRTIKPTKKFLKIFLLEKKNGKKLEHLNMKRELERRKGTNKRDREE